MNQLKEVTAPEIRSLKNIRWFSACRVEDALEDGGVCVKCGSEQIALFYFSRRNEWFATQNECPHRKQMALSRGMTGSRMGEPKVACPFHKKSFSLKTGECLDEEPCGHLRTFPVKVEDGMVYIALAV